MPRFAALVLSTVVLVAWRPTRADNVGPTPILDRADRALARALPVVFENGTFDHHSVPSLLSSTARHSVTIGELTLKAAGRLDVHFGAGMAELVDAPANTTMRKTGLAGAIGASYALFEPACFRVGVEVDMLRVQYGAVGFTDERVLLALTMK
jgi:hypothetical protein